MPKFIKEVWTHDNKTFTHIIRPDHYSHSFQHIMDMVAQAQKDSGQRVKYQDIEVILYGGPRFASTMGIEFKLTEALAGYEVIRELELAK